MTNPNRYGRLDIALHWVMALLFMAQFATMQWRDWLDKTDPALEHVYGLHSLGGFAILILGLIRLVVRLRRGWLPHTPRAPGYQKLAARLVHVTFYLMFFAQPVTGILSTGGKLSTQAEGIAKALHSAGGWVIIALVTLHVAAVIYHQVMIKDDLLRRMWVERRKKSSFSSN
ncbi:MAG: cytochrome b [Pseudomonadota bacterium]